MKILIAGDFYPSEKVKTLIDKREYDAVLGEVAPIVKSADYSIVNYESPVVLGDYKPIVKCGPNLASTECGVEAIKWTGFDMATLANNHIYDFGSEGLADTIKTCEKFGIDTVGVGKDLTEAQKVFYKEIDGKSLAIINCCEHEFSIADDNTPGANPLNPVQQFYQIQKAHKNADYVIVIVHGGHEHFQLPSPRMVETYRFFIDAGADAVVNHHQHCYSGYEVYKGKPIFYGLGNFCFENSARNGSIWNEGYMVELNFSESITYKLFPYVQCFEHQGIIVITSADKLQKFNYRIEELNAIIVNSIQLKQTHEKWMDETLQMYKNAFEIYKNRYVRTLYYRGLLPSLFKQHNTALLLNFIDCEAHRDCLINLLKKNSHE